MAAPTQGAIDFLAKAPVAHGQLLIDGQWVAGEASAHKAFEDGRWRGLAPAQRKAVLHRLAELIENMRWNWPFWACTTIAQKSAWR
jgi:gamma-glutamyl-gamma-aminobutyraldehyde dehydrogenase